ncbi:MAG TPA: hypothetical protein VLV18_01905 [Terriglobales bacterium]|nr:hypothetical protein [Terriglobales bacterium]
MPLLKEVGWFRESGNWIIGYAIALHLFWGIFILLSDAPLFTTPIHTVAEIVEIVSGTNRYAVSAVFLIAAILSYVGLRSKRNLTGVLLMMPQQSLLVLTAIGGILAAINGHYADGVPRPSMFILADQFPPVLIAAAHTLAIVAFAKGTPRR